MTDAESVQAYVDAFLVLLAEAAAPGLEDYLAGVPAELREQVFEGIDAALANPAPPPRAALPQVVVGNAASPEGDDAEDGDVSGEAPAGDADNATGPDRISVSPAGADRWVRLAARCAPRPIRHQYLGEMLATRAEMRQKASPRLWIELVTVRDVFDGLAQHAPLKERPPRAAEGLDRATLLGWPAWRLSGAALLAGWLAGSAALLVCGAGLIVTAFATLVAVVVRHGALTTDDQTRFFNAVVGGAVATLGVTFLSGVLAAFLVTVSMLASWAWLAAAAMEIVVLAALLTAAVVTASGWSPEPWFPKRLVRV